jgi:hypothetical protein
MLNTILQMAFQPKLVLQHAKLKLQIIRITTIKLLIVNSNGAVNDSQRTK